MIFSPRSPRWFVIGALLSLAFVVPPARAAAVPGDKVAVLPLALEGKIPARPAALDNAVSKGLEVAVGTGRVLAGPPVAQKLAASAVRVACNDPRCWVAVGQALGARHLVTGLVQRKDALFEVEFRLVDAQDGSLVLKEVNQCEAADCSVAELCRLTVLELGRKGLGKGAVAGAPPASPSPSAAPAPVPQTAPVAAAPASPVSEPSTRPLPLPTPPMPPPVSSNELVTTSTSDTSGSWRSWYPAVGIASGVVVAAIGAYSITKDGDCTKPNMNPCQFNYTTMIGSIAAISGGALLLTSGVVVWIMGDPKQEHAGTPRLALGLGRLTLSGKF